MKRGNEKNNLKNIKYNKIRRMNKANFEKLFESELIKFLSNQKKRTYKPRPPIPTPRKSVKPKQPPSLFGEVPEINVPILKPTVVSTTPRKSVKQMAKEYKPKQPPSLFGKVPEINVPILKPTVVTTTFNKLPNVIQKTTENVNNWEEWLKNANEAIEAINATKNDRKNEIMNIFKQTEQTEPTFTQKEKALQGFTKSYEISLASRQDPLIQLQSTRSLIKNNLLKVLNEMKGLKFNESLKITFVKQKGDELIKHTQPFFSETQTVTNEIEIADLLQITQQQIVNMIQQWISEGSGWTIQSVDGHFIKIIIYKPLKGSSYIPLPKELQNSGKGIINMKNNDNECFRWCHIRQLLPQKKDPQRIKECDKKYVEKLDYSGIEFPVHVKQYNKIEKKNNIRVNVFGYEEKQPYVIYISKEKFNSCLNLLLLTEGEVKHYCLIKDFNKFMYNKTKHKGRKHFCMYCLQCLSSKEHLEKHKVDCIEINGKQAIKMPEPGSKIAFRNYRKQLPAPFVIYADFEAITEKANEKADEKANEKADEKSYTKQYQKHTACGYGYKVVCCYDDKFSKPIKIYRGEMAIHKFMKDMLAEVEYCREVLKTHFSKPLKMTDEDEESFQRAEECHICKKPYIKSDDRVRNVVKNVRGKNIRVRKVRVRDVKVRDHCHVTGKYRGSAHQDCNLNFKLTNKIPVVFHNLKGYDSHFIMQEIGDISKNNVYVDEEGKEHEMRINVIPCNMEKYLAFMLGPHLVFIDSFQFMSSSLSNLVKNLPAEAFKHTGQVFQGEQLSLMTKKGVYPYDYMDSFEKFEDNRLPKKEDFFSIMNNEHITDEEYQHAQNVWNKFSLTSMGEYHDLYLKSDILLLADVFENFRKACQQYYELDPAHYFTSPGLSWDAMLKMTNIELELISDVDMFQFIEKGMRGGTSYIANRYGKANNKYMKNYNPEETTKYIMYLDANNLYGWAMSQYLPTGGFEWLTEEEVDLSKYNDESEKGLVLEVNLEYPEELHDLHNDYPLAAEKIKVTEDMLSPYCREIAKKFKVKVGLVGKLVPTLLNKEKYVLHYRNLQLYLSLGLKLTKIHRALEFDQSPWLKSYINFNTKKRAGAKNSFEKDFFKLMNNSVFGKTMENLRKRQDIKLITDKENLTKWASRPSFISSKIFNEDLVAIHKAKTTLTLNRPAYVGMCILDLSKTLMYDFHYNYIKSQYGDKARLLFTDTDSLTYEIEADDVYQDFWKDKNLFDNSDYPEDSPFFDSTNKKVIGKFKDEVEGIPIVEFVGLRSKMYSYMKDKKQGSRTAKGTKKNVIKKVSRTAKGIKKNVIEQELQHDNYINVLFNKMQMRHTMRLIKSEKHRIGSYVLDKISLSCFDDKRYIHENGVTSYAYGHNRL